MRFDPIMVAALTAVAAAACGNGTEPGAGLEGYYNSTWRASTINGQALPYSWQDIQFQPLDTMAIELKQLGIRMGTRIGTNGCVDALGSGPPYDADCCVAEAQWSRNGGADTTWQEYCLVGLMGESTGFQVWWNNFQGALPSAKQGSAEPVTRLTLVRAPDCGSTADFSCPALTMVLDRQ